MLVVMAAALRWADRRPAYVDVATGVALGSLMLGVSLASKVAGGFGEALTPEVAGAR